ncbi:glycogen synthase GlgA [Roseimaritima ulvae]|uniref:Glycogen synthase n=1 Tax=Roseimaritima ulvae TaxID=980254 RepID=A0A5B9QXZ1_9BACT|nr:glycogen synthase GlgA [Roseimaritima ulvae]QEG38821.1 Glycogen synthase [Roseimaritima ulvae]
MNIVLITTEAVPFAKTGGLADVCGALPVQLANHGHNVTVLMPAFRQIHSAGQPISETDISLPVDIEGHRWTARLASSTLPDSEVPVYFIDQPDLFDRPQLYGDEHGDYQDNCLRFSFFSQACLQAIERLKLPVDIVHCNDWQTGLVPAYISTRFGDYSWMDRVATVLTIHNLAYQGVFSKHLLPQTGMGWEHFRPDELEFYDQLNLLKTGIVFADAVTTVSARYAEEIQTEQHGCGLQGVLHRRAASLTGIPNGIDTAIWDPATDPHLVANYSISNWQEGKASNKRDLQETFGLNPTADAPLIGLVGRLAEQKGWGLVIEAMRHFLSTGNPAQWVVLGTGDRRYHAALSRLAGHYGDRLGLHLGFSDALAHRIEAGADIFLMPSRYEPCGLNQLYSLRYGTVPVVNPTGGLSDTVVDATSQHVTEGTATGFYLPTFDTYGLIEALSAAFSMRRNSPEKWTQIIQSGMTRDWSWGRSAVRYEQVYEKTSARKHGALRGH